MPRRMPAARRRAAHAAALAALLAATLAPPPPAQAPDAHAAPAAEVRAVPTRAQDAWHHAAGLLRVGHYAAAQEAYLAMAESGSLAGEDAPRALFEAARAARADGDAASAASLLRRVKDEHPTSTTAVAARFTLGVVLREAGECRAALDALLEYEAHAGPHALGPYLALQRAACYARLEEPRNTIASAEAALAVEGGGPRLARIEAHERAAEAHLRLGQRAQALPHYEAALGLASTRAYRAEMLFNTGTIARALGRVDLAAERFRAVVVEYPDLPRAPGALEALDALGRAGSVSPLQAGLVRLSQRDFTTAIGLFEQVPPSHPEYGAARFNLSQALLRRGDEATALDVLRELAESVPAWAGQALLRAGRVHEGSGRADEALALYERLLQVAAEPDRRAEARVRLGLIQYQRGHTQAALDAWRAAADPAAGAAPALRAQAGLWEGKAWARLAGVASGEARAAWTRAASTAPEAYYGLRAGDLVAGRLEPRNPGTVRPPTVFEAGADERGEHAAWLAARGSEPAALAAEVAADPSLVRADTLLDLGLRDEATWEMETPRGRYVEQRDLPRLAALADWLAERDLPHLTLEVGRRARDLAGIGVLGLPVALQKDVYPVGWGDVLLAESAEQNLDPLLMLGLIRQESAFNARARSSAQAMGLTQVIPSTGRDIARALGLADQFRLEHLYRPAVSLDFGTWYLARQLDRYGGRIFPALAAYNAGAGNADRWLAAWGSDPDLFVEMIPFAETYGYVRLVYENYRLYETIYARG